VFLPSSVTLNSKLPIWICIEEGGDSGDTNSNYTIQTWSIDQVVILSLFHMVVATTACGICKSQFIPTQRRFQNLGPKILSFVWGPKTSSRCIRECKGFFLRTWCGLYISICALHRWRLLRDYPNRFFEYGIFAKVPMLVGDDANEGTGFVTKTLSKWIQRTPRLWNTCNLLPWIRWCGIREQILLRDVQCKHFTCYHGLLDQLCPISESGSTLPSWQLLDHVLRKKQIFLQTSRTRMGSVPFKDLAKCQF
jgi:hypothetical protein